jgi:dienelactone hydrolase
MSVPTGSPVRGAASVVALVLAVLVLSDTRDVDAAARTVLFRSFTGKTIEASLNEASQRPAPAVVLVGNLGHPRDDWQAIAQRMADARITTLAIDLPGAVLPGDPALLSGWSDEVRAAVNFLASRPDTRPGAIGILGASLGASLAAIAASADLQVRSLALVSPVSDYRGLRIENALRQFGARQAYLVASRQDPYAARSARELAKNGPGPREVQLTDVAGNGTSLLIREPDLVRLVIEWFQRTLG